MEEFVMNGMYGLFGGAVIAGFGYLKNIKKEKFELEKAGITIILGAIIGAGLTLFQGIDIGNYDAVAYSGMVTYAVEKVYGVMKK